MSIRTLRIAVISDLHCHASRTAESNITYLLSDKLRDPSDDHPVESLVKIIRSKTITTDLTLCPGDFTDKSDIQGFISGWGFSLELHRELKSNNIIATLGNHDVDVYQQTSNYSLTNAKGIKRGFPIPDQKERDIFWSKGCVFVEETDCRILVINSSHFHYNKQASHNGEISDEAMEYINEYLDNNKDDKIQIAMSHHPPVSHPRKGLGEDDKIVNGDKLLDILGKFNFDMFIYGHKHDPFLKYYNTTHGNVRIPLFSSGSFSSSANVMFAGIRNAFHIIELKKNDHICKGKIETWTFLPKDGWKPNFDQSAFAPRAGFGNLKSVHDIYNDVVQLLHNLPRLNWNEVTNSIDDIDYLIPEDSKKLNELFEANGYKTDFHLWEGPNVIYNLNYNAK